MFKQYFLENTPLITALNKSFQVFLNCIRHFMTKFKYYRYKVGSEKKKCILHETKPKV